MNGDGVVSDRVRELRARTAAAPVVVLAHRASSEPRPRRLRGSKRADLLRHARLWVRLRSVRRHRLRGGVAARSGLAIWLGPKTELYELSGAGPSPWAS